MREVIVEAVRALSFVRAEPAPDCILLEFTEDACTYACRYWIDDVQRDDSFDSDVRSAIWYALHRGGHGDPVPVAEHQRHRDERGPRRSASATRSTRGGSTRSSRVDVFRALDAEKIDRLARRLRHVVFGPGEVILRQGDPGDSLYVVRGGTVAVQIGVLGASKEVATLGDGQFFGEMSLMTGESRTATVVAKTDVECYVVDKEAFQRDRPGEARAGRDHQRHPVAPAGRPGREADADAGARRAAQTNQLRSKIAAFFGIGGGKARG